MPPIHQRIAPAAVLDVLLRLLSLVAMNVANAPPHMVEVVLVNVVVVLLEDLDDPAPRLVALRLAPIVALSDGLRLVSFELLLELVGVHVDHLLELLADLLVALSHACLLRLD